MYIRDKREALDIAEDILKDHPSVYKDRKIFTTTMAHYNVNIHVMNEGSVTFRHHDEVVLVLATQSNPVALWHTIIKGFLAIIYSHGHDPRAVYDTTMLKLL